MHKPMSAGTIDEPPLDYSVLVKMDAENLVTITANLTSDVGARYATPPKPWVEHKALLTALPDLHEDEPERVEREIEWNGRARMEDVSLTSIDLRRLDLRAIPPPARRAATK
jgi:hypothetical protein